MLRNTLILVCSLALLPLADTSRANEAPCAAVSVGAQQEATNRSLFNVGQTIAGTTSSASYVVEAGVIPCFIANAPPPLPGDCNDDGGITLADFTAKFEVCISGPSGGLATGCDCVDVDEDGDADTLDYARFQEAIP